VHRKQHERQQLDWLEQGLSRRIAMQYRLEQEHRTLRPWPHSRSCPEPLSSSQLRWRKLLIALLCVFFVMGYCVEHHRESLRITSNLAHESSVRLFDCGPNSKTLQELDFVERAMLRVDPEAHSLRCQQHLERLHASAFVNPMHVLSLYVMSIALFPVQLAAATLLRVLSLVLAAHGYLTQILLLAACVCTVYMLAQLALSRRHRQTLPFSTHTDHAPRESFAMPLSRTLQHMRRRGQRATRNLPYFADEL
jgi:hypothetical protein